MQEDRYQFNQIYLETIKKFLETENKYYEKIGALNREFESESTCLTTSYNSNLQDLQKEKDIEISNLQSRTLELAKKANDLVALANQSKEGATDAIRKVPQVTGFLPSVKSEQSYESDLKTVNSLDSLMATISELAHMIAEDEKTVKGAVYKLLLLRKKRSKGRAIIIAIAPVVVILAVFSVSVYNLHLLYNGYKRANTTLEQKNWGLVNSEIEKLKIARGFRRLIMPIFFGENSYNCIFKTFGISESNINDIKFTLLQREAYYRAGMEAYSSQNWQEAINIFKKIEQFDKVGYSSLKFPEQYASNIVEYQKERGLEYFDDTVTLLNKSQSQYSKINEIK